MFNFKTQEEVLNFVKNKKNNIKFIRIIFSDVLGRRMSFSIPASELKSTFESGKGFDGSSIEGFARIEESDLNIVPDPKTFRVLPWDYEISGATWKEAIVFGDIYTPDGKHFESDSRYVLKKTLENTKNFGKLFCGPELEFFIFADKNNPKPIDHGGYFYGGYCGEIRKAAQLHMKNIGVETECDHHEVAPSQHEICLKYSDAMSIADSIVLAKYITKRTAEKNGKFVSFMPKPISTENGSGMHLNLSLWDNNKNLFFESEKDSISPMAKKYIMGLIKYGKEIQPILNQWVNSYKRLIPGFEAPVYIAWGEKNRSTYIRVPLHQKGKGNSVRVELRNPDPCCNIYLALALTQSAGTHGIKENLKFIAPEEKDIFKMTKAELKNKNIDLLSENLEQALSHFKKSKLAKETFGDALFEKIIQNKEIQWLNYKKAVGEKYKKEVSPYEINKFLPIL